jgi:TetR/AcrR family transcriptional repressor of nem operon
MEAARSEGSRRTRLRRPSGPGGGAASAGRAAPGARERILRAASVLFRQHGYAHSSLEDILARADVRTISHFYYYFPSKETLALEVIDRWAAEYEADVFRPSLGNRALRPRRRLELLFELMDRRAVRHPRERGCPLGNLAAEVSDRSPRLRVRVADAFRRWERDIQACWRAGIDAREIAPWVNPRLAALCTVAGLQGAYALSRVYQSVDPVHVMHRLQDWALRATDSGRRSRPTATIRPPRSAGRRHPGA